MSWAGCHGVRLDGRVEPGLDVGRATGEPLLDADVTLGPVDPAAGEELWRLTAEVPVRAEQVLRRAPGGALVVESSRGGRLAVDAACRSLVVDAPTGAAGAQLLVTYGLPLLLPGAGALVVHGAAAARDGRAVLVCGPSGRGKSSLLVGLTAAGWSPLTEDLAAVDLRGPVPVVWPGPPWVRRRHGEPGPAGAGVRFETPDKTAWDLAGRQPDHAVPLALVAFLDEPGGDGPSCRAVGRADAVARLAGDAVWLGEQDRRGEALFGPVSALTRAVPAVALRAPRRPSWLDGLPELLAGAA